MKYEAPIRARICWPLIMQSPTANPLSGKLLKPRVSNHTLIRNQGHLHPPYPLVGGHNIEAHFFHQGQHGHIGG